MYLFYGRFVCLVLFNLEYIVVDNLSEVIGWISGYSILNDLDLEEFRELDFDIEDEMLFFWEI